jgi:hypothetical protein
MLLRNLLIFQGYCRELLKMVLTKFISYLSIVLTIYYEFWKIKWISRNLNE